MIFQDLGNTVFHAVKWLLGPTNEWIYRSDDTERADQIYLGKIIQFHGKTKQIKERRIKKLQPIEFSDEYTPKQKMQMRNQEHNSKCNNEPPSAKP